MLLRLLLLLAGIGYFARPLAAQKYFEASSGAHLSTQLFAQYPSSDPGRFNAAFARQLRGARYHLVPGVDSRIGGVLTARTTRDIRFGLLVRFGSFAYDVRSGLERGGDEPSDERVNSTFRFGYGGLDFYLEKDRDRWGYVVGSGMGVRSFRQATHRTPPPVGLRSPESDFFLGSQVYGNSYVELRRYFAFQSSSTASHPDRYFLALRTELLISRSNADLSRGSWGMIALNAGIRL